ncbi:MAG: glutamate--tRNA ligase [Patescibacteria group bacterium]
MGNNSQAKIRVRIAPSPTGFVHIGNLRTILYNYLMAKNHDGTFLVRIEDTDRSRYVDGAVENMLSVLKWADIDYDEGPFLTPKNAIAEKGENGPYFQSKRLDVYHHHIKELIDSGKAYYCFCSKERLDNLRSEQTANKMPPKYDGCCRHLSRQDVQKKLSQNIPHVVRFKMPENKEILIADLIRGEIRVNSNDLDDYVLIKSDKFPTYHFANVVDDHLMKITHVLRGDEWIPSTPKHVLLYEAFAWPAPVFAHLPQLINKQKKKLSKRDGSASVNDYIDRGYLPDALINFIALLGWNPGSDQEIFTRNEMIKQFDLSRVHKAAAVFDTDKLDWMNSYYIRQLDADKFLGLAAPFLIKAELIKTSGANYKILETNERLSAANLKTILTLEQPRIKKMSDLPDALEYFFKKEVKFDKKILLWKKNTKESTKKHLQALHQCVGRLEEAHYRTEKLNDLIKKFIHENNHENGDILWPMRVALSGREASPGPFEIAACLGKKKTLERIESAISML